MRRLLTLAALTVTCAGLYAQETGHNKYVSPWKIPWEYRGARGAEHWSQLAPEYAACNEGRQQSPIDIRDTETAKLPALRFDGKDGPLEDVINNGHTIRVDYPPGNGNFLLFGDQRYELTQFHFHHPSEELIAGKSYPMAAHLMYRTSDGKVAGVTVFVQPGRPNDTVGKLWAHMPMSEGQNEVSGVKINPARLVPEDTHSYFAYTGSLTAPPCTEGVTWFVLRRPIPLSRAQIDAFGRLYPNNARPVQLLNGRVIKESR